MRNTLLLLEFFESPFYKPKQETNTPQFHTEKWQKLLPNPQQNPQRNQLKANEDVVAELKLLVHTFIKYLNKFTPMLVFPDVLWVL
jgi:hypothetical protein